MSDFHEVRFPARCLAATDAAGRSGARKSSRSAPIGRRATPAGRIRAGATKRAMASSRWRSSPQVIAFFEERRGRLYGFRWRDRADFAPARRARPSPGDQQIGAGDGVQRAFQLVKTYGGAFAPYSRTHRQACRGERARRRRTEWRRRGSRFQSTRRRASSVSRRRRSGGGAQ